jgi:hypothetical protein
MNNIISYLLIVLALTLPSCSGILEEIPPQDTSGTEMLLALDGGTNDMVASSALALKKKPLSPAQSHAERVLVIGESVIFNTTNDLKNLSKEAKGQKLAYDSDLSELYNEMSSAFGMIRTPIKLFKFEPQMPQLPGNSIPTRTTDLNELNQYYFEPESPNLPATDMPWSNEESRNGVTVIWNQLNIYTY